MLIATQRKFKEIKDIKFCEDLITSIVFEPLTYMSGEEVWSFFKKLIPLTTSTIIENVPKIVNFEFWPNLCKIWPDINPKNRIEPDLLVRFYSEKNILILTIMFEMKWGNGRLNTRTQLYDQWKALPGHIKDNCFHIYLVMLKEKRHEKDIDVSLEYAVEQGEKKWKERLILREWKDIGNIINDDMREITTRSIKSWSENLTVFLAKLNLMHHKFCGFNYLKTTPIIQFIDNIFWNDNPFFSNNIFQHNIMHSRDLIFYKNTSWFNSHGTIPILNGKSKSIFWDLKH